jgi:hypothetical protein
VINAEFKAKCDSVPNLFAKLMDSPRKKVGDSCARVPGIYVFFEGNLPIYVGRTRNLRQRMTAHVTQRHNSGSFAFRLLRKKLGLPTSYRKEGSRLQIQELHAGEFSRQIARVRRMEFCFLEVSNPIEQYLLELYAAMELSKLNQAIDMQDFDTH